MSYLHVNGAASFLIPLQHFQCMLKARRLGTLDGTLL